MKSNFKVDSLGYFSKHMVKAAGYATAHLIKLGLTFVSPLIIKNLIDIVLPKGDMKLLVLYTLLFFLTKISLMGVGFCAVYLANKLKFGFDNFWKSKLLAKVLYSPITMLSDKGTGYVAKRIENDIAHVSDFIIFNLFDIVLNIITIAVTLIIAFHYSRLLFLIFVFVFPLYYVSLKYFNAEMHSISSAIMEKSAQNNGYLNESIGGKEEIKCMEAEDDIIAEYDGKLAELMRLIIKRFFISMKPSAMGQLSSVIAYVLLFLGGGYEIMKGHLTIGVFVFFNTLMIKILSSVGGLVDINISFQKGLAAMKRVGEINNLEEEDNGGESVSSIESLACENVGFKYKKKHAVKDISLNAKKGDIIIIRGANGSGKSTLFRLLTMLLSPDEGRILINNQDLNNTSRKSYRNKIAIVRQAPYVFNASIRENLLIAFPHASESDIRVALEHSGSTDMVDSFDKGLDFILEEDGRNVSGGQKQRLMLARALLRNPELLLLDEATQGIDAESRDILLKSISDNRAGRITCVITHDDFAWDIADQVIDL